MEWIEMQADKISCNYNNKLNNDEQNCERVISKTKQIILVWNSKKRKLYNIWKNSCNSKIYKKTTFQEKITLLTQQKEFS
jgi:hypothetical protein